MRILDYSNAGDDRRSTAQPHDAELRERSALDPQASSDRLRELGALKLLEPLCRSDDEEVRRLTWHET